MSSSPPLVVADRYRLVAPLGQGGMGRVWRANDVVLHRDVAIKELVPPPGLTPAERQEMRERSLREARAIARLNNINVVRVFDVLRTDADPWIVMEYVPSRSLQDTLASDGPLNPVRVAEIGLGVLNALRAAHRAGVVHRDVKPGNVLLGADGRVVLTDFGLATVPGDPNVTRTGLVLGSPAYIAPERARDGSAGPAADLWSLGATLYAAVEGASPFARPSAIATLAALATENPPPARNAGPLKPVLNGLLRKDPAHRINADETERLLLRAAGRRSRMAFPMSPTMRRPGAGRERPAPGAASAPVVPGPRPPIVPPRPAGPPGQPPLSGGRTAGDTRPVFVPGKAPVGRPAAETPTRVDAPKVDAPRLDATRPDTPAIRDDQATPFGTREGPPTASTPGSTVGSTPSDQAHVGLSGQTSRGGSGGLTAADIVANRRNKAAAEHELSLAAASATAPPAAEATTVVPPATRPEGERSSAGASAVDAGPMPSGNGTAVAGESAADQLTAPPRPGADAGGGAPSPAKRTGDDPPSRDDAAASARLDRAAGPEAAAPAGGTDSATITAGDEAPPRDADAGLAVAQQETASPATSEGAAGGQGRERAGHDGDRQVPGGPVAGAGGVRSAASGPADVETEQRGEASSRKGRSSRISGKKSKSAGASGPAAPAKSSDPALVADGADQGDRPAAVALSGAAPAEDAGRGATVGDAARNAEEPPTADRTVPTPRDGSQAGVVRDGAAGVSGGRPGDESVGAGEAGGMRANGDTGTGDDAATRTGPAAPATVDRQVGTAADGSDGDQDAGRPPVPLGDGASDGELGTFASRSQRPAWQPMPAGPTRRIGGVTVLGTRLTYWQAAIGAGALLVVLVLVVMLGARAFSGGTPNTSKGPATTAPAVTGTTAPASGAAAAPTVSASTSPSPPPSASPSSPTGDGGAVALPAGWKWYTAATQGHWPGFTIPVPQNAAVTTEASMIYLRWNNRLLLMDRTDKPASDPVQDWRDLEAHNSYRNYHMIRIVPVDYFQAGADWEFTYTTDHGNAQHVDKRNVVVNDHAAYSLNWYTSPEEWGAAQSEFQLILKGFKPQP